MQLSQEAPLRWAHTYTGNLQTHRAGSLLQQLLPPIPITPHTILSTCLLELNTWDVQPASTAYLSAYTMAAGKTNAYTMAKDAHRDSEQEERRLDDLHFQDELLAAGYDPTQGYASLEVT